MHIAAFEHRLEAVTAPDPPLDAALPCPHGGLPEPARPRAADGPAHLAATRIAAAFEKHGAVA